MMRFVEYILQEDTPDGKEVGYGFMTEDDDHEKAIGAAATDVINNPSIPNWTLSRIVRSVNPELHDAVDAVGEFHLAEVAKFDRAIGIIYTDL